MIRKTSCTIKKKIYRGEFDREKQSALYIRTTFWLLFIPIYSYDELVG